jgi:hypothetical protein
VPDRAVISVDLVVIATLVRLVAEEMDGSVVQAIWEVLLVRQVLQAVRLVPTGRKNVEGNLAAYGVAVISLVGVRLTLGSSRSGDEREFEIRKLLLQRLNKLGPHIMLQIELIEIFPLLYTSIPANRANIYHPIPELHERASLHRDIEICDVVQAEAHEFLVVFLAYVLDEAVRSERHA